jgi:hypothetical protein
MASDKVEVVTPETGLEEVSAADDAEGSSEEEVVPSTRVMQTPGPVKQQATPAPKQSMTHAHPPRQSSPSPSTSSATFNSDLDREPTVAELEACLRLQTRLSCETLGDNFSFPAVRERVQDELDISCSVWKRLMQFGILIQIYREEVVSCNPEDIKPNSKTPTLTKSSLQQSWSDETGRPLPETFH